MARSASQETLFIGYTIGPNGADGVLGKLDQAGNLDSSFANGIGVMNLKSIAPFNGHVNLTPYVLAVDSSDRIYVAMRKRYGTLLARFLPSGQLDSTFSTTGVLSVSFPQGGQYAHMPVSLSINLNDEITYAYWALTASGTALTTQVITKLDSSGAVISSFGNAGNILVPANNGAEFVDMEVDQSNRMLLLTSHCQISRYFATGVLDTSFGVNGTTASLTGLGGGSSVCRGLTLRPTGAPIISGTYQANPTSSELLVARFDNTGNLVSSFANGGVAIIGQPQFSGNVDGNGYAFTVLQSSGRILAALRERPYYHNFAVTALEDTPLNIVPRPANLGQRNNVALNTLVYSDPIMIDGLDTNTQVLLSITEGEYSVNNGSFTSQHGYVSNGDVITVRHTSRNCYRCRARSVIKVGGFLDQKNGHQRIGQTMRTQFNSFTYGLTSWPVR